MNHTVSVAGKFRGKLVIPPAASALWLTNFDIDIRSGEIAGAYGWPLNELGAVQRTRTSSETPTTNPEETK